MKKKRQPRTAYVPTRREELANTLSHAAMLLPVLGLLPVALRRAGGDVTAALSAGVCLVSVFLMLLSSTLYHAQRPGSRSKALLHKLDHICIFVAIAGTYTPVALLVIGGWQGVLIVALQWTAVLAGIFYKTLLPKSIPAVSLTIYLVMGWSALFFLPRLIRNASQPLLWLIVAGGVLYTAGAAIYAAKSFRYHHLVWHLLIDLALAAHLTGIVFFIF